MIVVSAYHDVLLGVLSLSREQCGDILQRVNGSFQQDIPLKMQFFEDKGSRGVFGVDFTLKCLQIGRFSDLEPLISDLLSYLQDWNRSSALIAPKRGEAVRIRVIR